MELQLEDLEASATEDERPAQTAAARTRDVASFEPKRPARKPFLTTCRVRASSSRCRSSARAARPRNMRETWG